MVFAATAAPVSKKNSPAAPDRELVDRLFAGEVFDLGVHDPALVDVDLALDVAVGQMKTAGLSRRRDELDDVGQREFGEGSLETHRVVSVVFFLDAGRRNQATRQLGGCQTRVVSSRASETLRDFEAGDDGLLAEALQEVEQRRTHRHAGGHGPRPVDQEAGLDSKLVRESSAARPPPTPC